MPAFSQIKADVQTLLIDTPTAIQSLTPRWVNKALKEIQRRHNFKVMEAETGQLQTTTGVRTLTGSIPTDFKELRDRPYLVENTGFVRELISAPSRAALQRKWEVDDTGAPRALLDPGRDAAGAGSFEVWPLPDGNSDWTNGQYRIVVPYWRYLPDLSADADTNWFTTNAEWFLIYHAVAEGFFADWDESRATIWAQKAQNELSQLILADKNRALMEVDTLVPYPDVHAAQLRA